MFYILGLYNSITVTLKSEEQETEQEKSTLYSKASTSEEDSNPMLLYLDTVHNYKS